MMIRIILFLGICYVTFLLSFNDKQVPFSEDSGIKALMVKQYQDGNFQSTLVLNAPKWVNDLWDQGLYPFRKPFVYDLPDGKTVVFPPLFQILSTPFYMLFGFKGLYIIPALSIFLLWILFIKLCETLKLHERVTQLTLVAVIFSSSLTLYAAIFWEHTLTSLLCLYGLFYLIHASTRNENPGKLRSLLFGITTGLSLWLRPEALIILIALLIWSLYYIINTNLKSIRFFVCGISISIAGFLTINYFIFDNLLGLRSKQIVDRFDLIQRLRDGGYILIVLCIKAILYDPICLFVLFCIVITGKTLISEFRTSKPLSITHLTIFVICLFYIMCPWILPNTGGNNWGIRYALVCTPFIYVLAAILGNQILMSNQRLKTVVIIAMGLTVAGIVKNTIGGGQMLFANYKGAKSKVVEYIKDKKTTVVLITKSYHAAEFESLMPESAFLLTDTEESLQKALNTSEARSSSLLLIYDKNDTYSELPLKESNLKDFTLQKTFNNFLIYKYSPE